MAASKFILFVLGLMLLIAGYILQVVQAGLGLWPLALYAAGAASLAWYAVANRADLATIFTGRGARRGAASLVMTAGFIGILVMAGLFSEKHHYRLDLTKSKTHTIALQSRQQLEKLEQDTLNLQLYVFYRGETGLRGKQGLADLLDTYVYYSDRLKYEMVDIDRNPLLAMQLGITSTSAMILTYGERQEKIYSEQEAKITQAIANLLDSGTPGKAGTIFYLTGHGEPSLGLENEGYSMSEAVGAIEDQIGPVSELVLAGGRSVPDSCDVLIVAGPQTNLLPAELSAIESYLAGGGSVLFMVEPFMADTLVSFLAQYGVAVGDNVVIDMLKGAPGTPFAFLADDYPSHDITRFFEVGIVFDMARTVDRAETPPAGAEVTVLARSSDKSAAVTDSALQGDFNAVVDQALDEGQAAPLAVAVTLPGESGFPADSTIAGQGADGKKSRLVVFGDRHLFVDGYLGQLGNRDLLLNTMRWLGGQADEITIAPKVSENTPLSLERGQMMLIGLVSVVALPAAVIFIGIFVWVRRRSKR
ncbi:MAG: hypothetical protein FVQ81_05750 [Candidatus Glassbacteria bacterium]|nr:hypothetical protein [Candidatus Glassbacteria bacterium]